jgi:UDP-glucose 4-epimerase
MVVSVGMRTALVTGGAGFLGTAVTEALAADGYAVTVLGRSSRTDPVTRATIVAALEQVPELVVHCAGSSSVALSVRDPEGERAKTVPPFAELLAQLRAHAPAARLVLLSSAAVYGNAATVPTPETSPIAPLSPYGEDKVACEQLLRAHGGAAAIVRLFSVYGPGLRKQLLWDACQKASAGVPRFAGTGDEERDWLHVRDAAALIVAAGRAASSDVPIVNGGTGRGTSVREVVGHVCRELGAPAAEFSGEVRAGDPARYVADITRARSLGWAPRIDIARGIAEYVAWFRS